MYQGIIRKFPAKTKGIDADQKKGKAEQPLRYHSSKADFSEFVF